jgi:LPXTG-motif cell wall-anchored protein
MIKTKFVKAFMLGMCVSALSAGVAFAETVDKKAVEITTQNVTAPDSSVPSDGEVPELAAVSGLAQDDLNAKLDEVNKIIFEDNIKDIESKEIAIMSTAPLDGSVEIGILPFTKENIEYIYGLTGKDQVKVVEGVQPELMATSGIATDGVMTAFGDSEVQDGSGDGNVKVISVGDNNSFEKPADGEKNNTMTIAGIAGVAALLGGAVLMSQKKKSTENVIK